MSTFLLATFLVSLLTISGGAAICFAAALRYRLFISSKSFP